MKKKFSKIVMAMRRVSLFAALVVAMTAVSCVKEMNVETPENPVEGPITFEASFGAVSKAVLEVGEEESKVAWETTDQVSVLVGESNYLYVAESEGYSTKLSTKETGVPAEGTYYAVYPYDENAVLEGNVITTSLPATQAAVLNSFSSHLSVSQAVDNSFSFRNVCGLVRVNVASDNVTKVTFAGNNNETVAGAIKVTVSGTPTWEAVEGETTLELVPAGEATTLERGDYYLAVLPQTFENGITVTAWKGENAWDVRKTSSKLTIERSDMKNSNPFGVVGSGTESDPYLLDSPQDLVEMRDLAKVGKTTYFKMIKDIDMKGVTGWVPVNYDQNYARKIHFDGGNFTIKNLSLSKKVDGCNYTSIFGVLYGSCKNLKIDSPYIESTNSCGVVGGYVGTVGLQAVLENVHITNATVTGTGQQVGGVCGVAYGATFKNVSYQGKVESTWRTTEKDDKGNLKDGEGRVGGLMGMSRGEVLCEGCSVNAVVSVHTENSNRTGHVGGFVGRVHDGTFTAKESTVNGTMTGTIYLGGFIGVANSEVSLTSCTVGTEINATSSVAGLVGQFSPTGYGTMTSCAVTSKIKGSANVAGLVAIVETSSTQKFTMTSCSYTGEKIEAASAVGGLIGNLNGEWTIKNSDVTTDIITTDKYVGGLIGSCNGTDNVGSKLDISYCTFEGNVISTNSYVGGIIGVVQSKSKGITMSNVSSKGSVEGSMYVGGAIGAAMCTTSQSATDSWSESSVKVSDKTSGTYVKSGGFIGAITAQMTVTNCHATGEVIGGANCNSIGGLVGQVDAKTTIEKCYATGNVSNKGGIHLAGLVGAAEADIKILKSYSTGKVTKSSGSNRAAGLIAFHKTKCVIENCYATGDISNAGQQNGGLVGYSNESTSELIITNCFASGNVGTGRGSAGILGNSQAPANKTTVVGCIAWNAEVSTTNRGTGNYAPAAIVGSCYDAGTFKNCWHRADMVLTDSANLSKLVDQDDCEGQQLPALTGAPSNALNPNRVYQGKAAAADATISSVAKAIGWDETIWDLSKDVPTLK